MFHGVYQSDPEVSVHGSVLLRSHILCVFGLLAFIRLSRILVCTVCVCYLAVPIRDPVLQYNLIMRCLHLNPFCKYDTYLYTQCKKKIQSLDTLDIMFVGSVNVIRTIR